MWVFTNKGFISAVAHRTKRDHLLVRARRLDHLQAIFPGVEIRQTNNADYKYRVVIHRDHLAATLMTEVANMAYDNFKNSIVDHEYHDACSTVWRVMHKLQPGSYMPELPDMLEDTPPEGDMACPDCGIAGHISKGVLDEVCTFCGSSWQAKRAADPDSYDYDFGDPGKYEDDDQLPSMN